MRSASGCPFARDTTRTSTTTSAFRASSCGRRSTSPGIGPRPGGSWGFARRGRVGFSRSPRCSSSWRLRPSACCARMTCTLRPPGILPALEPFGRLRGARLRPSALALSRLGGKAHASHLLLPRPPRVRSGRLWGLRPSRWHSVWWGRSAASERPAGGAVCLPSLRAPCQLVQAAVCSPETGRRGGGDAPAGLPFDSRRLTPSRFGFTRSQVWVHL